MAYNFGSGFRARGGDLARLSPLLPQERPLALSPAQLEALAQLGADGFHHWAVRGWFEGV